jgi:hypothetical protein
MLVLAQIQTSRTRLESKWSWDFGRPPSRSVTGQSQYNATLSGHSQLVNSKRLDRNRQQVPADLSQIPTITSPKIALLHPARLARP